MGHTFSHILCHIIFSTKGRLNYLYEELRPRLFKYMYGIAKDEGCRMLKVGGVDDHVHILIKLKPSISVSDLVRKIKTNSSKWIHENRTSMNDFAWQSGFSCFSVSESIKNAVIEYIDGQEQHHLKVSFSDELKKFLEKHQVDFDKGHYLD